jgi:hypothetical protein
MIRVADLQEWMYDNVDVLKDGPLISMIIKKLNLRESNLIRN